MTLLIWCTEISSPFTFAAIWLETFLTSALPHEASATTTENITTGWKSLSAILSHPSSWRKCDGEGFVDPQSESDSFPPANDLNRTTRNATIVARRLCMISRIGPIGLCRTRASSLNRATPERTGDFRGNCSRFLARKLRLAHP